ncbi:MAG TPA: efflux RND transporter permease subunit [Synergistaceae bacterium]|nr:efflux RND transporter permease subunit [Synergistaceae bacterium]
MKITDTALRRPVTVLIGMIALLLFGYVSLTQMGIARMPDIDFPIVVVVTTMEGASPAIMDNDVTDVLEEEINSISGIEAITSYSYEGRAITVVEFELGRDIDGAAADVRDKVSIAQAQLPDEADAPTVQKYSPMDSPVLTLAVLGNAKEKEKTFFVDNVLKQQIQTVTGVGTVDLAGFRERQIRIWLDPNQLESRGLTATDVRRAIQAKHVELPAGRLETATTEFGIRVEGEYSSVESLAQLPLANRNGTVIRLRDVARVEDGFEELRSFATYNGEPAILVQVKKQRGANEVATAEKIRQRLEEIEGQIPEGIRLQIVGDESLFIRRSMEGVRSDILVAVGLTSLIMLLFLNTLRAMFVTVVTIPVCLLGSMLILRSMGITINNLTMMGLSLAVGMVVDATTVVLENIHHHLEHGEKPIPAASLGTSEVGFSVLGGSATTLAVFLPVAFMEGIIGRFFYDFGMTVAVTILMSLTLSLTLTPYLCSRLLRANRGWFGRVMDVPLGLLERGYAWLLGKAVRHRFITLVFAGGIFALGIFFASQLGSTFFPTEDNGEFTVSFELPTGSSLEESERIFRELDERLRKSSLVAYTYGTVGMGTGQEVNKGDISVELIPRNQRPNAKEIMNEFRQQFSVYKDVIITLTTWDADVSITLVGNSTEELAALAETMKKDLARDNRLMDVTSSIQLENPRVVANINRELADDLGVSVRDLSTEIQAYFGGLKAGVFKDGGYRYDIQLQAEKNNRASLEDIERIIIPTHDGNLIRIADVVNLRKTVAPNVITRYQRQRSIEVQANVQGISTGEGTVLVEEAFARNAPENGSIQLLHTGSSKHQKQSFVSLINAIGASIILVYMVMAIQFESFIYPLMVMFALPLTTAGAFGLLLLTGQDMSVMSLMGIILLIGIVVNNAIILVDFAKQESARGANPLEAMLKAAPRRLRPILMTACSTMIAQIPLALGLSEGGEIRQPMAIAVIGGMFSSTLLTLLVIPAVYIIIGNTAERIAKFFRAFRMFRIRRKRIREESSEMLNPMTSKNPAGGK